MRHHGLSKSPPLEPGPPSFHTELLTSLKKLLEVGILYDMYGFKILKMNKKDKNMKRFMWVCKVWLWKDIVVVLTLLLLPLKSFTQ